MLKLRFKQNVQLVQYGSRDEVLKHHREIKCRFELFFILIVASFLTLEMQRNLGRNCRNSTF